MSLYQNTSDQELFKRIAANDEQAFEAVFHRYTPRLRPFVLGMVKVPELADEIIQEVFLKLWTNRTSLQQINEPSAWLHRIASNLAINQLRRQATEYKYLQQAMKDTHQPEDIVEKLSAKELQELIHQAISRLPEKRREIYMLTRDEGLSHREIAERLGISLNTVKNQVVSALREIQEHIYRTKGFYIPVILLGMQINFSPA
jgi:RNA polymerase sigma-70 factor (family 1)